MTPAWLNIVLPIVTLILGYGGTLVTEARRDARARAAAHEERVTARTTEMTDKRRAFELEILVRCTDKMATLNRQQAMVRTKQKFTGQGAFGDISVEELAEMTQLTVELWADADLILDETIRRAVRAAVARTASSESGETADEAPANAALPGKAIQLMAERIRAIYDELVTTL